MNNLDSFLSDIIEETPGFLSYIDKIDEVVKKIESMTWCGVDGCEVLECAETAFEAIKAHNLSVHAGAKYTKKAGKITLLNLITAKCRKCGHLDYEKEIVPQLSDLINLTGVRTDAVPVRKIAVPDLFYDRKSHGYWHMAADGAWQQIPKETARELLGRAGLSNRKQEDGSPSEAVLHLLKVNDTSAVDWAGPLAGYKAGVHIINGKPYLATSSFREIETTPDPACDHCPHLLQITYGLFGETQAEYMLAHLKNSRHNLREGLRMGGMATLIAGEVGIAKTFFIEFVVKPALGGRVANVYDYLTGRTPFNQEIIGSEVHLIDDGNPFADREARRAFSNMIKQSVASAGVYCHAKGRDGITLPLFRRLFLLANLDALEAMPTLEASLLDKILLFKAYRFVMPEGLTPLPPLADPAKVKAFQAIIAAELPYFLWVIDNKEVPEDIRSERFGLKAWKHPELVAELESMEQNNETNFLVQTAVFNPDLDEGDLQPAADGSVEIEVNALLSKLHTERATAARAKRMFTTSRALGNSLGRMGRFSPFYTNRKSNGQSFWLINRCGGKNRVKSTSLDG